MTAMADIRPVGVTCEVDVFDRGTGEGFRADLRVHVDARIDAERLVPVAMRWTGSGIAREHMRLAAGGRMLGPLQPWAPEDVAVRTRNPVRDRRRSEEVALYDLTREIRALEPHAITGQMHPPRRQILVEVRADGSVAGVDRGRFDLGDLEAEVARIRAVAAETLLFREPEGWFVPQPLPSWVVTPNRPQHPAWRVELQPPSNHLERVFSLGRLDVAREFCRWMNQGEDGPVVGEIVEIDRTLATEPDDLVRLARAVPAIVRGRLFRIMELEGPLVRDWHAAINAPEILPQEDRTGAERILQGCVRLAGHLAEERGSIEHLQDWAPLLRRIEQEGLAPMLGPGNHRP